MEEVSGEEENEYKGDGGEDKSHSWGVIQRVNSGPCVHAKLVSCRKATQGQ